MILSTCVVRTKHTHTQARTQTHSHTHANTHACTHAHTHAHNVKLTAFGGTPRKYSEFVVHVLHFTPPGILSEITRTNPSYPKELPYSYKP